MSDGGTADLERPPEPARILLVDDTPTNLSLLVDALQAAGYRPLVANSGEAALARLASVKPSLILLDMRMPGLDGMETIHQIQAHAEWREIPVIFMTAVEEPEQKVAALAAGAVDYVTKPFHVQEVLARIGTHLRLKALQQALADELAWRAETERTLQAGLEQAVLVATRDGKIQFCTQRASQLLVRYFGGGLDGAPLEQLPARVHELVRVGRNAQVRVTATAGELEMRVVVDPASDAPAMLLFEEHRAREDYAPLRALGLTEREAEVLYWISEGKSNADIGVIIGAAAATVKKHAENLFAKLGASGRTEAMLIALPILNRR